jgi:hypothetical protein
MKPGNSDHSCRNLASVRRDLDDWRQEPRRAASPTWRSRRSGRIPACTWWRPRWRTRVRRSAKVERLVPSRLERRPPLGSPASAWARRCSPPLRISSSNGWRKRASGAVAGELSRVLSARVAAALDSSTAPMAAPRRAARPRPPARSSRTTTAPSPSLFSGSSPVATSTTSSPGSVTGSDRYPVLTRNKHSRHCNPITAAHRPSHSQVISLLCVKLAI